MNLRGEKEELVVKEKWSQKNLACLTTLQPAL